MGRGWSRVSGGGLVRGFFLCFSCVFPFFYLCDLGIFLLARVFFLASHFGFFLLPPASAAGSCFSVAGSGFSFFRFRSFPNCPSGRTRVSSNTKPSVRCTGGHCALCTLKLEEELKLLTDDSARYASFLDSPLLLFRSIYYTIPTAVATAVIFEVRGFSRLPALSSVG